MNNSSDNCKPEVFQHKDGAAGFDSQTIVGAFIWLSSVLYSSFKNSSSSQVGRITMSERILTKDNSSGMVLE